MVVLVASLLVCQPVERTAAADDDDDDDKPIEDRALWCDQRSSVDERGLLCNNNISSNDRYCYYYEQP